MNSKMHSWSGAPMRLVLGIHKKCLFKWSNSHELLYTQHFHHLKWSQFLIVPSLFTVAQNLQSIILSQIQATQNGGSETETVKKPTVPTAGTNGTVNPAKGTTFSKTYKFLHYFSPVKKTWRSNNSTLPDKLIVTFDSQQQK